MSDCKAVQYSDQMSCECGNVWDMNDADPPECQVKRKNGMSNHTPGPWEAVVQAGNSKGTIWCSVETPEGDLIPVKAHDPLVWIRIEDALLIAAAPEMLEALEYLVTRLDSIEDIRIAQEAIAKAEGSGN